MTTHIKEFNAKHGIVAGTQKSNYVQLAGGTAGNPVTIYAQGSDENINIRLVPKGTGIVELTAQTTASVGLSNDITTNIEYYPTFATASTGVVETLTVSNTKLKYNPNLGRLTATSFSGIGDFSTLYVSGTSRLKSTITGILQYSPQQITNILTASDSADSDYFGTSVALSSDASVLVIGAINWEGTVGTDRGAVYTYDWTNSGWVQRSAVLQSSDAADSDYFGSSVALSSDGTVLAVGASNWEGAAGANRGGVYIYDLVGAAWVQRGAVLEASDAADDDYFGSSVALSSDATVLIVGARTWEGATGINRGCVYTYDWSGSAWVQRGAVLQASDAADEDRFGVSVAISSNGTVLVVGALNWEGTTGTNRGGVYIYDKVGLVWTQRGTVLESGDAINFHVFGSSVALSNDATVLIVGARSWEGAVGADRGAVYIYDWTGSFWAQRGEVLETSDAADTDLFGSGVALSSDAGILVVTASYWEFSGATDRGSAYTYSLTGVRPAKKSLSTGAGWVNNDNTIKGLVSGNELVTIDAFGLMTVNGTGTINANSSTSALRITQVGNGNALLVEDSANPDSTPIVIDSLGHLIIGAQQQYATSQTDSAYMQVLDNSSTDGRGIAISKYQPSAIGAALEFTKSRSPNIGSHSTVVDGDTVGTVLFAGSDGTNYIKSASIVSQVDGVASTGNVPGRLVFSTATSGGALTSKMQLDNAGRLTIRGTPVSNSILTITGNTIVSGGYSIGQQLSMTSAETTSNYHAGYTTLHQVAANITVGQIRHFLASQSTFGSGSSVASQYGFYAADTLIGATANYGFFSAINTGASRWNFYAAGTAPNYFGGNVTVNGTLTVNGTTTTVNSTTITVDDPVFTLGGDTAPASDDNKDRGIEFRYHTGTVAKLGFFGFDDSTGKFTFIPDATNTSEVFSGTKGTIDAYIDWTDVSNKPSSGFDVNITNDVSTNLTYYPTFATGTGNVGGLKVSTTKLNYNPSTGVFSVYILNATGNIPATSTTSGSLVVTGGAGISQNLYVGGNLVVNGAISTINSSSVTFDDPVITIGGDTAPASDNNKDRGIEFRYHNGATAKVGYFGFDDSTGKFTFIPDATNTAEVFSGVKGTIDAYIDWADVNNKPAAGFEVNISDDTSTDLTYYPTFSTAISGTLSGLKVSSTKLRYNPNLGKLSASIMVVDGNVPSTSTTTGTLIVTGGVGISGALNATTKSFIIPHPTKKGKNLRYGSLESPYHGVRLTGRGVLKGGLCVIKLPAYINKLVHSDDVNIQLTNIKHGKVLWVEDIEVNKNKFTIRADTSTLIPGQEYEFFWDFTAERKDVDRLVVEG